MTAACLRLGDLFAAIAELVRRGPEYELVELSWDGATIEVPCGDFSLRYEYAPNLVPECWTIVDHDNHDVLAMLDSMHEHACNAMDDEHQQKRAELVYAELCAVTNRALRWFVFELRPAPDVVRSLVELARQREMGG